MGAGIAVMFKKKFKGVGELKEQSESARFIINSSGGKTSYFGGGIDFQSVILFTTEKLV